MLQFELERPRGLRQVRHGLWGAHARAGWRWIYSTQCPSSVDVRNVRVTRNGDQGRATVQRLLRVLRPRLPPAHACLQYGKFELEGVPPAREGATLFGLGRRRA